MSTAQHNADSLPDEVARPMVRRLSAEQDRYINAANMAKAVERIADLLDTGPPPVQEAPTPTLRALVRHWIWRWRAS